VLTLPSPHRSSKRGFGLHRINDQTTSIYRRDAHDIRISRYPIFRNVLVFFYLITTTAGALRIDLPAFICTLIGGHFSHPDDTSTTTYAVSAMSSVSMHIYAITHPAFAHIYSRIIAKDDRRDGGVFSELGLAYIISSGG
jgi:hypothetical protein